MLQKCPTNLVSGIYFKCKTLICNKVEISLQLSTIFHQLCADWFARSCSLSRSLYCHNECKFLQKLFMTIFTTINYHRHTHTHTNLPCMHPFSVNKFENCEKQKNKLRKNKISPHIFMSTGKQATHKHTSACKSEKKMCN